MNPPTTELEIDDIDGDDEDCSNTDETNNEQEIRGRRHMPQNRALNFTLIVTVTLTFDLVGSYNVQGQCTCKV